MKKIFLLMMCVMVINNIVLADGIQPEGNVIFNEKTIDISQTNINGRGGHTDEFVENGDNTEDVMNDPNSIPPKVKKAIELANALCNEDGAIVIPYSKKHIRAWLLIAGYKKSEIDRAISESKINWKGHAAIIARTYYNKNNRISDRYLREILREEFLFNSDEVNYAISVIRENRNIDAESKYINPSDFMGMTDEEKKLKLATYGFDEKSINQALEFIKSVEYVNVYEQK